MLLTTTPKCPVPLLPHAVTILCTIFQWLSWKLVVISHVFKMNSVAPIQVLNVRKMQQVFSSLMHKHNMEVKELNSYTQEQFRQLSNLMTQLSEQASLCKDQIIDVLNSENSRLYVILDGEQIIGCATLCITYSPLGTKAFIEDVVVSEEFRGRGFGRLLIRHIISEAGKLSPISLHLTSRPCRIAANALYQSMGFKIKETNCYTLSLK